MALFRVPLVSWVGSICRAGLLSVGLLLGSLAAWAQAPGTPIDLRCEYLTNPLSLNAPRPRLTWRLPDDRRGAVQAAYQLTVGPDSLAVARGGQAAGGLGGGHPGSEGYGATLGIAIGSWHLPARHSVAQPAMCLAILALG